MESNIHYTEDIAMMYTCITPNCFFTFEQAGKVDACPDCGKRAVREATKKEIADYIRYRAEFDAEYAGAAGNRGKRRIYGRQQKK